MIPLETCKPNKTDLEQARFYFDLFRKKHRLSEEEKNASDTLEGDYYFSQFSLHLISVDSVEITEAFGKELREQAGGVSSPSLHFVFPENPKDFQKGKYYLEALLKEVCFSENESLRKDLIRVLTSGGKRLRPALCWAAYNLQEECVRERPILPLMLMIELMHSVSLIHDDVVDGGLIRRGVATINSTGGNQKAVQAGDFLLGRAMDLLRIYKGTGINERLAKVSQQMCLGELNQLYHTHCSITADQYKTSIEQKTALFIEASATCGAMACGADPEVIESLEEYGYNMGMAFQIRDDILDIIGDEHLGKSVFQDKNKGLITLPLLVGVDASQKEVENYSQKAREALKNIKDNPIKKELIRMTQLLAEREV